MYVDSACSYVGCNNRVLHFDLLVLDLASDCLEIFHSIIIVVLIKRMSYVDGRGV